MRQSRDLAPPRGIPSASAAVIRGTKRHPEPQPLPLRRGPRSRSSRPRTWIAQLPRPWRDRGRTLRLAGSWRRAGGARANPNSPNPALVPPWASRRPQEATHRLTDSSGAFGTPVALGERRCVFGQRRALFVFGRTPSLPRRWRRLSCSTLGSASAVLSALADRALLRLQSQRAESSLSCRNVSEAGGWSQSGSRLRERCRRADGRPSSARRLRIQARERVGSKRGFSVLVPTPLSQHAPRCVPRATSLRRSFPTANMPSLSESQCPRQRRRDLKPASCRAARPSRQNREWGPSAL